MFPYTVIFKDKDGNEIHIDEHAVEFKGPLSDDDPISTLSPYTTKELIITSIK